MGNIGSCCSNTDEESHDYSKSKKMVAADLHSSGAQASGVTPEHRKGNRRPNNLVSAGSSSRSQIKSAGTNSKYSGFSLHGVQKTSPVEQSDENLSTQDKVVQHKFLKKNVASFFETYKDKNCDDILEEGIAQFCTDLEVDPAEFIVLALAWKFKVAMMCKFTRQEFTEGCAALQVDSINSLKDSFPSLEKEALANFRDLYKFAFQFGLDVEQGQRSLPCDVAIGMWQVVFSKRTPALLKEWIRFLGVNQVRGISRDTWNMFLHFTDNITTDLNNYDDSEAWPSLFDDFVEYYRNLVENQEQTNSSSSEQNDTEAKINQESGEEERDEVSAPEIELTEPAPPDSVNEVNSQTDSCSDEADPSEVEKESIDSNPITTNTLHSSHC